MMAGLFHVSAAALTRATQMRVRLRPGCEGLYAGCHAISTASRTHRDPVRNQHVPDGVARDIHTFRHARERHAAFVEVGRLGDDLVGDGLLANLNASAPQELQQAIPRYSVLDAQLRARLAVDVPLDNLIDRPWRKPPPKRSVRNSPVLGRLWRGVGALGGGCQALEFAEGWWQ